MKKRIASIILLVAIFISTSSIPFGVLASTENIIQDNEETNDTSTEQETPTEEPEEEIVAVYRDVWIKEVVAYSVDIPEDNGQIITKYELGQKISVTQHSEGWFVIEGTLEYIHISYLTESEEEAAYLKMNAEVAELSTIKSKKDWFIAYKALLDKYSYIFDPPESIYDRFGQEEIELLCKVLQAECGDYYGFDSQCNVVSVIFNMWENRGENASLKTVLFKKNAFSTVSSGKYKKQPVTEQALLACEYVFMMGDTTGGCVAFRSGNKPQKWYDWELMFIDKAGHGFYK